MTRRFFVALTGLASRPGVRRAARIAGIAGATFVSLLAAALVTSFTVDLGPTLRHRAEVEGSKRVHRPMHIGGLSIRLLTGTFVVDDLVIEGLTPTDRPFLKAKRIAVSMPLTALLRREVLLESVEMTDWQMVVETFPNGRHNFPKLTPDGPPGKKRFTTTLKYVRAWRGEFTFEDHGTPWSTVARHLDITVTKPADYRGEASFSGGTVRIQNYLPMQADMRAAFKIDGGIVRFSRIDLNTDGAHSTVDGDVDLAHWPEQFYRVHSRVNFPRMREIFFAGDKFTLSGDGNFDGTFHLYKGGRELKGTFFSDSAGVNALRFTALRGSLLWLPDRFKVFDTEARFYGGTTTLAYAMAPLGGVRRGRAIFDASYEGVQVLQLTDALQIPGIRLAGVAAGANHLEWPLGRFADHAGGGQVSVEPIGGPTLQRLPLGETSRFSPDEQKGLEWGPFSPRPFLEPEPVGGEVTYTFTPDWIEVAPSRVATPTTLVEMEGRTAYGDQSRIPFHVTSADWQESDRLLAGAMTAFGAPTGAVPIGGRGEFDGAMTGAFRSPRIEGRFRGEEVRAWNVNWGSIVADIAFENGYLDVTRGVVTRNGSELTADGRFAMGYPRRDGGEEINARIKLTRRPVADLRHAFALDDYRLDGLLSGEFHLYGKYEAPFGFGRMTIENGIAYGESFETGEASLRFEGPGVRMDAINLHKSGGVMTGAAYVGWNGTYSFQADAQRIPVETIKAAAYPRAPLSGLLQLTASGSGTFDSPRYEVRGRISDLFIADEGVGDLTARLSVRDEVLTVELEAASPRLAISGAGRISLNPEADAEVTFRFTDTSLDPYVRTFVPKLSPFTTAVASGTIRVVGELSNVDHLLVDGSVEELRLGLFDYPIRNDGPVRLALDQHVVRIDHMRLVGEGTELDVLGSIELHDQRINVRTTGSANLGILQGFFRDLRSSGQAELVAEVAGALDAPLFSGSATITSGRIRHFSLPHSLEAISGRITFDARAIRLDELKARLGGGEVQFGGRIGLKGYAPGDLNVTAVGQDMHLRYPEGVRSVVDADLALRGTLDAAILAGTIDVKSAIWTKRIDTSGNLFELVGSGTPGSGSAAATTLPVRFDLRVIAPATLRIENNAARIVLSADLALRGTYDRPTLFGRAEVDRGEVLFEGKRYFVNRGTIDFSNPARIDPFFDIEAETRVRVPGQTYRVIMQTAGTRERLDFQLTSDPPLPQIDILSLLFGDVRSLGDVELNALRTQDLAEQQLLQSRAARLLASPISSEIGRVVEQTFGVDTFQITPSLIDPYQQSSRLSPAARLTIGKRVSDRVYITFSRSLASSTRDQIILLEYDQTDRLSWILTQNEDYTYSLDVRVRHSF